MISKEKFVRIINSMRDFYERLNLIEKGLGVVSDKMSDFPALIMEELEEESRRNWPDSIWDDIYNSNKDPEDIYENILDLEAQHPIKSDDIVQVLELFELKKLFKEEPGKPLYFETAKNKFYWIDEFEHICGKMYQVENVYWDDSFSLRGLKRMIHLPAEFVRLIK